ncbi:MAG: hypothetical protein P8163_06880 [Candidatus Thiodiazotropha sp.]
MIYREEPESGKSLIPTEYELLAFALALGEGLPGLGPIVLKAAVNVEPNASFHSLLAGCRAEVDEKQVKLLDDWLDDNPDWSNIPAPRIADAFRKVERFLFRIGAQS